ncbi:MAG TPA: 2-amino-4-hydroxy-6-hydroxymethyldihydropteridine diphosphokinase [Candidatus Saccharimonadales bacterium]|nr:2-amino-4-hydroxy-6-hydroxymethyldihydropteridine diphosphokinase [Candidatus Saccharimonadales bacterium]
MATVYLALGSNVGDSLGYIDKAVELLGASVHGIERAPVYRTKAVGFTSQADFLNTALRGRTDLKPAGLLEFVKKVEKDVGRKRTFRFGPRQIDIDIIFYDDLVVDTADLAIPHHSLIGRDFVLRPICDLDPGLKDPATGRTVKQMLDGLAPASRSIIEQVD